MTAFVGFGMLQFSKERPTGAPVKTIASRYFAGGGPSVFSMRVCSFPEVILPALVQNMYAQHTSVG